jgi:two-component system, OmpR family, copper resistance phosphate regulon response regulator CusR
MNGMLILFVDANPLSARFVSQGLSKTGLQVEIAGDGQTASQLFDAGNFDLVILDVSLPRFDGFELCRHFRRQCSEVPILILSGSNDTPDKLADLQSCADDYLLNPFHFEELLARVHALLRRTRLCQRPSSPRLSGAAASNAGRISYPYTSIISGARSTRASGHR